jgi:glucoamylase
MGAVRIRRGTALLAAAAATLLPLGLLAGPAGPASAAASAGPAGGLAAAFNNVGSTAPAAPGAGDFDGTGDSFAAPALARDALVPGQSLLHDGVRIDWPDVAAGQPDNVVADGQQVALHGTGTVLGLVGASAYGTTSGTVTVHYADGSSSTAPVSFADWTSLHPAAGSDLLATTGGWDPGGSLPVSLFYAAIPLTAGRPVVSVTLPPVGAAVGRGVPSMHVFSLTVGTPGAQAAGAPGAPSYYDLARKDCAGTAAGGSSRVWYTVADGTLSDVYAPTIDNTDVKSLDPVVTGPGFTALQPRDMSYTVAALDSTGMACQVTAHDAAHHFDLVTDFITDPAAEAVIMRYTLRPQPGAAPGLSVYLRFNPLLNGHGGGGAGNAGPQSATVAATSRGPVPLSYSTNSFTAAVNRDYASPIYAALAAGSRFGAVETGYAGSASDGLTELDSSGSLTTTAPDADNGNVVQTVKLGTGGGAWTVALGFGTSAERAVRTALSASATPFPASYAAYRAGWRAYDAGLAPPGGAHPAHPASAAAAAAYWRSANVLKASEDKTFPGATAASLASPWGQAVPAGQPAAGGLAPYFGSYREVFPRDTYEAFTGFLADGDLPTARQIVRFLFADMQRPDGSFPRNGLLNGQAAPDTGGLQLDETADPILMAWQAGLGPDGALYREHIRPAADFLVAHGPADGVERWEEQTGFSPSTMADEVAGLVAAAAIARAQRDPVSQRLFLATADDYRRLILATGVTHNGPLSSQPYFIRVDKTGNPDAAFSYPLGNGDPTSYDQRAVVDQGFLELARLGELPASDPVLRNSLAVTGAALGRPTPSGTGILRYNGDGYGDCEVSVFHDCQADGQPWATSSQGTGHPWPVLSGENAEYQLLAGDAAAGAAGLGFMLQSASGVGLVPEQVWDYPDLPPSADGADPATASIGFTDGRPDGSAAPLTWAQAQLLRLVSDQAAGRLLDQPSIVAARYLPGAPAAAALQVTAPLAVDGGNVPANLTRPSVTVNAASVTVRGTAAPGATVDVAVTGSAPGAAGPATTVTTVTADSAGAFSAPVSMAPGSNAVEVAATAGSATNEALFTVTDLHVPGTVVLNVPAAPGGGNGPGTYAYPTATNADGSPVFAPGSFRLTGLTVIDSGATVSFQVGLANLQPTFGSLLGAQLIDLYLHAPTPPAGQAQSTAAAGPWHYSIAPADAWNQLIEVDGFGTDDWVTPAGSSSGLSGSATLGTPQVSVAQLPASGGQTPGLVTVTVPAAVLGHPGSGWTFTLTLTGQDGFGNNDARTFTATPGGYTFGVCSAAVAASSPPPAVCAADPGTVPLIMDTIPPSGVDVRSELDPTAHPAGVVLPGVTVP